MRVTGSKPRSLEVKGIESHSGIHHVFLLPIGFESNSSDKPSPLFLSLFGLLGVSQVPFSWWFGLVVWALQMGKIPP